MATQQLVSKEDPVAALSMNLPHPVGEGLGASPLARCYWVHQQPQQLLELLEPELGQQLHPLQGGGSPRQARWLLGVRVPILLLEMLEPVPGQQLHPLQGPGSQRQARWLLGVRVPVLLLEMLERTLERTLERQLLV